MHSGAPTTGTHQDHEKDRTGGEAGAQGKLRVVFMLQLRPGEEQRFLAAYEQIRHEVARVPGHLRDQVCRSLHEPDEWLITSEWASPEHFLAWERTESHRELAAPMRACVANARSLRYVVHAETVGVSGVLPAGAAGTEPVGAR